MIKILKAVGLWLLYVVTVAAVAVLGAFVLLEWLSGCGETYVDSDGVTHMQSCGWSNRTP